MLAGFAMATVTRVLGGEDLPQFSADLDGDGTPERIVLEKFAETENEGAFYQLLVLRQNGEALWKGPRKPDAENTLVFGAWHFGVQFPELVADIDGDGAMELVAPMPQSDVSPTYFRVARWHEGEFVPVRNGVLLESPQDSGRFPWSLFDAWQGVWISGFQNVERDGEFVVNATEYQEGAVPRSGEALVVKAGDGFAVKKWIRPLAAEVDAVPEATGREGVSYRARLRAGDHFNSRGARLTTVADILRQDRANYYKGKGDGEDAADPHFRSFEGRKE